VEADLISSFAIGLALVLTPVGLGLIAGGVLLGILIGATPGLSPSMGVALLVPFSYGMDPALAFVFFVAVYQAANYGGSITAIAINAPGTPSAVVTALDGFQLTKKGRPGEAMGIAVCSSAVGGFVGAIILILFAIPVAQFGLRFGPSEYFALAVFGLTTVVAFAEKNWLKTFIGITLGLLVSCIGTDPFLGDERFTLGVVELFDGVAFIPVMIGLFALGEIFSQIEKGLVKNEGSEKSFSSALPSWQVLNRLKKTILRSSIIGTLIGVIPGAGATIASFISYGQAKRASEKKIQQDDSLLPFGEGAAEGIAASEAANSSSVGGALVPLLSLGIPGSATDAVLLGALSLHGLVAGPELFHTHPDIVYGIFSCLFIANIFILLFGILGNRLWLSVIRIPRTLLYPLILSLCLLGSYTMNNSLFDSWVCLFAGVAGWQLKRFGYKPAPIVLGLVLGNMLEMNYRRVFMMGGAELFVTRPISLVLLSLSVVTLVVPLVRRKL